MGRVPVSIVVPAFNEAVRLPRSMPKLVDAVLRIPQAEVILVDDGSTDGTAVLAEDLLGPLPNRRILRLPWNSGKGTAVRAGVAIASGEAIVFMDADMASDINDLPLLLAALEHAEVALGSRRIGPGADRSSSRRFGSWAFNQLARTLTALELADTQCGFKAFRHDAAKILFSLSRATGFGFDVEVLSIARALGYRIAEVPVRWSEEPGGTFRITRHTPSMVVDAVRARRYLHRTGPPPPPVETWPAVGTTRATTLPVGAAGYPHLLEGDAREAVPAQDPALAAAQPAAVGEPAPRGELPARDEPSTRDEAPARGGAATPAGVGHGPNHASVALPADDEHDQSGLVVDIDATVDIPGPATRAAARPRVAATHGRPAQHGLPLVGDARPAARSRPA
ncbi:MAG: glycosyltransferase family 2 protein [Frankia sp.]|nr:glycosyltransferase family 2 protein [Frankia sp.]